MKTSRSLWRTNPALGWGIVVTLLVAGLAVWLGRRAG